MYGSSRKSLLTIFLPATWIGNPLERLGAEAEHRLDIAEANIHNALASVRARHDNLNRAYTSGLKYYTSNVRRVDDYTDYYGQTGLDYGNLDYTDTSKKSADSSYLSRRQGSNSGHPYRFDYG